MGATGRRGATSGEADGPGSRQVLASLPYASSGRATRDVRCAVPCAASNDPFYQGGARMIMLSKRGMMTALVASASCAAALVLPASATAATRSGIEYFLIDLSSSQTVAHGVFTGGGRDDANHSDFDILHLGGGTLRVTHPNKDSHIKFSLNPKSCFFSLTGTGTYTLGYGTGRFTGVTGHGRYVLKEQGIAPRTSAGACNGNARPKPLIGYVNASGPVTTPAVP